MAHCFKLVVDDQEYSFLERLAEHDGVTIHQEAQQLLDLQIWEEMQINKEFTEGSAEA